MPARLAGIDRDDVAGADPRHPGAGLDHLAGDLVA